MRSNRLKMNPDKILFIWLGTCQQLVCVNMADINFHDGTVIKPLASVCSLGVISDSEMTMLDHYQQRHPHVLQSHMTVALCVSLSYRR
jgi:hypothetical protein